MDCQKVTIAEVLHLAADEFLWVGNDCYFSTTFNTASCLAINEAIESLFPIEFPIENSQSSMMRETIMQGLENMGLDVDNINFGSFRYGSDRQGARYAWLKFAAMIAEEQGV